MNRFKHIICFFIILGILFCFTSSVKADPNPNIRITNVLRGEDGAMNEGYGGVITNQQTWEEFWGKLHANKLPIPKTPKIWFGNEVIVYCVSGRRPTGGYHMVVKEAIAESQWILIKCYEYTPHPTEFVSQAMTQPYHVVRLLLTPSIKRILPQNLLWKVESYQQTHPFGRLDRHDKYGQSGEMAGRWKGEWIKINDFYSENPAAQEEGDDPRAGN